MKPPNFGIFLAFLFCLRAIIGTSGADDAETILNAAETSPGFENGATSFTSTIYNEANVFYACKEEDRDSTLEISCSCWRRSSTLSCSSTKYNENWDKIRSKFNHTNIKVAKDNFVVKFIDLQYLTLSSLTKGQLVPYYENTIEGLTLVNDKISTIENGTFNNFGNLTSLDLGNNDLEEINDGFLTKQVGLKLLALSLADNDLKSITSTAFQYLKKLTWLNLSYNKKLTYFNVDENGKNVSIFSKGLSNLKYLALDGCDISYLESNVFGNLKNLKELHLSGNKFTTIPTMAIKSLKNLQYINIGFSELQKIDDCAFCNLTKLKIVLLSYNSDLKYIHENAFGSITNNGSTPNLDYFTIEKCGIQILPEKLLNWKNVKQIEIHGNPFICNCSMAWLINDLKSENPLHIVNLKDSSNRSIKHSLRCESPQILHNIKFYNLAGNFCLNETIENHKIEDDSHVTYVCGRESPDNDCYCKNGEISCSRPSGYTSSWNSGYTYTPPKVITHIEIIDNRENIKSAKFKSYKFIELKKGVLFNGHEKYFEKLDFSENDITIIGNGTFDNFISLKTLDLSDNQIKNITNRVLSDKFGSTLMELDLSKNLFAELHPDTFLYLIKLETLSLAKNPTINFSNPIFPKELFNLKRLDLRECNIFNFTNNYFSNLTSLETLILNSNPLSSIPKAIHQLSYLRHLHISDLNIAKLEQKDFVNLNELETISMNSGSLNSIEDCAFCNLSKLKKIYLYGNYALTFIHENAFGSISKGIPTRMELFLFGNSGITILPEKLLDWNSLEIFEFSSHSLTCNCSMAWLINDLKAMTPKYFKAFQKIDLYCYNSFAFDDIGNNAWRIWGFSHSSTTLKTVPECINEKNIIYSCGKENTLASNCVCENNELQCHYGNDQADDITNIQILNDTFILEKASFSFNNIKFLKKNNILPLREHEGEELDFSFNKIESIENGTFNKFTSLKTLILKHNSLVKINEGVLTFELGETLEKLDLSSNNLTNLTGSEFQYLFNLTNLLLTFNDKINFNDFVFPSTLTNMKSLDLGGCNISVFNEDFFINLTNLETLGLYKNPLILIPCAIQALSNLRHLDIHNSRLASLNNSDLVFHQELETLDVSATNISEIGDCTFCNLNKLKKVFLNQNHRLSFIHENAFGSNDSEIIANLEVFSIEKCSVSFLPENLLDWKTLKIIQIEENPFICDCSMAWLINGLNSFETVFDEISINPFENENKLKCFNPPQFRGVHFNNISEDFCSHDSTNATSETSVNQKEERNIYLWFLGICFCILVSVIFAIGIYVYRNQRRSF